MAFVIGRDEGGYVAKPGHKTSYVTDVKHARKFDTHEEAEREACDNEFVIDLEKVIDEYYRR